MGIRMLHRRTAAARLHAKAGAGLLAGPGAPTPARPLPAYAPGAATPRVPRTPLTVLRAFAARLRRPGLPRWLAGLRRFVPRRDTWRLRAEQARGYLALALGTLGRLRGRRPDRRIDVFVVGVDPLSGRPGGPVRR